MLVAIARSLIMLSVGFRPSHVRFQLYLTYPAYLWQGGNRGDFEPVFTASGRTLEFLKTLAHTWGPVSHFTVGPNVAVLLSDPDTIQSLRINDYDCASLQWLNSGSLFCASCISSALVPSSNASRVKLMHFTNPSYGPEEIKVRSTRVKMELGNGSMESSY